MKLLNRLTSLVSASSLLFGLLVAIPLGLVSAPVANAVSCASGMTAQNNLKAEPAHGQVFYIDSGVTPKVDAAYVGYKITNTAASGTIKGLWTELTGFTGGKVSLANPLDKYEQLPDITAGAANYKTAYFLLKAIGSTTIAQGQTLNIYDKRPDLTGANKLLTCTFSFLQVQETIKASANKINTVTATLNTSAATLGGTLTVGVTSANTGKVGAGKTPDFSLFWVSPAAVSTWPTRSLRLEQVTLTLNCTGGSTRGNVVLTLTDTLSLSNAAVDCFKSASTWTSSYVFRIIGPGPASLTPSPVAMIASGQQYKHSDISSLSFGSAVDLSGVSNSAFTVTVSASSTVVSQTSTQAVIAYTVRMRTTATVNIAVDEMIDNLANGVTYQAGSAKLNGVTITDPVSLASEAGLSPPPLHYIGPFNVINTQDAVITYNMVVPCSSVSTAYTNTVYAKVGDQVLGSSTTQLSAAVVTTVTASGSCSATTTTTTTNITPTGQTYPASSIASSGSTSSATLNGFANAYSQSNVTARFRYSLDANLVNSTTLTATQSVSGSSSTAVSQALTGLQINKTYYFRIEVTSLGGTQNGTILSFTTPDVLATPTVTTGAISNLSGSGNSYSVTLSGLVNPHLNTLTPISFEYCVSAVSCTSSSMPTTPVNTLNVLIDDGSTNGANLSLSGSADSQINSDSVDGVARITGLDGGKTYFYRVKAICAAVVTTYCPSTSTVFYGGIRQFTVGAPIVSTTPATVVARTTATVNGTYDANGAGTPQYNFRYCEDNGSTCNPSAIGGTVVSTTVTSGSGLAGAAITANLTGLTGNKTYYFQTIGLSGSTEVSFGDILAFTTLDITTSSLPGGTVNVYYQTSVVGAGGSGSYSFTASGLPTGLLISSVGVISGTPTVTGTFSVDVTITDSTYGTTYTKTLSIVIIGVTTTAADPVAATTATIKGSASVSLTTPKFCYSSTDPGGSFDIATCTSIDASGTNSAYTANLSSLSASTRYYFQLTGVYSGGQYYGAVLNFTTLPTVATATPTSVTAISATIGGSSTEALTEPKLCYSASNPSGNFNPATCTSPTVAGSFTAYSGSLTSLTPSTTYYYQMTGKVGGTSYFGTVTTFLTLPTVTTSAASSVAATTSTLNGSATEALTSPQFCLSTTNPSSSFTLSSGTCASPLAATDAGSNTFTYAATSLTASTTYYFQLFGTVSGGSYKGAVLSFKTAPTVTTSSATSVGTTSAVLPGSSTEALTTPKFCLSSTNPGSTFDTSTVLTCSNTATSGASNTYSYNATGLTPATTYYFMLFGTVGGTTYKGSVVNFTTVATHTITVTNGANGSTTPTTTTVASGSNQSFVITANTGYHIEELKVDGTAVTAAANEATYTYAFTNVTSNRTLEVTFAINTYTVTYFDNGKDSGTVPASAVTYNYNTVVTVLGNTGNLLKASNTFAKWNTSSTGNGIDYAFGATFNITQNMTLYPLWISDNAKTVTFNINVAGLTETSSQTSATTANLNANPFTRTGYAFKNWTTNADGTGTPYAAGASYSFSADLVLYAQWNQIFTITYNSNGGGSAPASSTCTENVNCATPITLPLQGSMSKTGYTFNGWTTTCDSGTGLTGSYTISASATLCARWIAIPTYTITYNGNNSESGTVPSDATPYYQSDTVTVSSATLERAGYTYAGWNTASDGSGTSYLANGSATLTMGAANVILYAKWTIRAFTVTYFGNGNDSGAVPSVQTSNFNTKVNVSSKNTLAKSGYNFLNWYTNSIGTGGTSYSPNAELTIPANNVELYAIWGVRTGFTVTFDINTGDSGSTAPQSASTATALRANGFSKSGYIFAGWATSPSGSKAYDDASVYDFSADITLYAKWTASSAPTFTFTYDGNGNDGGSVPTAVASYTANATVTVLGNTNSLSKTGFTFESWYTTSSGTGGIAYHAAATMSMPSQNMILYAKWVTASTPPPPSPIIFQTIKPAIVWKNPLPIRYKTLLSATQLNAVATLPTSVTAAILDPKSADQLSATAPRLVGTYSYLPMSGQMLSVGIHKLNVTFTPLESGTYEVVSATVEIMVRDVPTLTWATPAPIKKGTPLGSTQLNAVGSVPGTYKYLSPTGTILPVGKNKLKVLFTPTDPLFEPIEGEVEIVVDPIIINPQATPIVTPSDTKASQPVINTTPSVILSVLAVGKGLTGATTNGSTVTVDPTLGFSGKTQVLVKVLDEGEEKQVTVPVTVLPLAAVTPQSKPNDKGSSTISWKASPNATSYEVLMSGKSICATAALSCTTNSLIGPKSDIKVLAKGNDNTVAPLVPAVYSAPSKPITALVVYFDTNKYNLDAKDKAELRAMAKTIRDQGFTNIVVNGHTDSMTGVDNKVLSNNRAKATYEYLKQFATGLTVKLGAFASTKPAVKGKSAAALASNRRAEVGVY